jgi:hypothetical protein
MDAYIWRLLSRGVDRGYIDFTMHGYVHLRFNDTGQDVCMTRSVARILARRINQALDAWARCRSDGKKARKR